MSSRTSEGIKYWVMGDGPEAVFCHPSLGLGRFLFHRLIPPLSRHYTVVTWDPRGIGDNAGYVPRLTDWVKDVVSMMDEVGKPAHLIGVSLGTWVMPRVALARPEAVQKLVMIGATPGFAGGEEQVAARRQEIEQMGMAAFARQYAEGTLARRLMRICGKSLPIRWPNANRTLIWRRCGRFTWWTTGPSGPTSISRRFFWSAVEILEPRRPPPKPWRSFCRRAWPRYG